MKKLGKTTMAIVAGVAIVTATMVGSAQATHGLSNPVDSIDGNGPGVFGGTLTNPAAADSADWFMFSGSIGDAVSISMTSTDFDAFLHLYQVPGIPASGLDRTTFTLIADDDDGGVGLNSLISIASLAVGGNFLVAAESVSGALTPLGAYNLSISGDISPVSVPEPATLTLFGLGLAGLGFARRRKQKAA